ncbi:MAG TPA: aspartyl protease family protein [Rhizomicrobium sp.]|jgi:predicted aspartyl protease
MSRFAIIAFVLCLGLASAHAEDKPECQLTRISSLPIHTISDGRITVPVTIENHPLSLLVDTGGVAATLRQDLAQQFSLPVQLTSRKMLGVNGVEMNSYVTPGQFSIGGMNGANLPFYLELRPASEFDGTLAPDMMQGYDVDIDFAKSTLNLFSQKHCRGKVVYWTKTGYIAVRMELDRTGHIRIPITIDGKKVMATIDTGAMTSLMSLRTASNIGIQETTPGVKIVEQRKRYKVYSYPFHALDFDGISVTNPHIAITSDDFTKGMGSDVILGIGILRQLHFYVAYGEERLYITPATAN